MPVAATAVRHSRFGPIGSLNISRAFSTAGPASVSELPASSVNSGLGSNPAVTSLARAALISDWRTRSNGWCASVYCSTPARLVVSIASPGGAVMVAGGPATGTVADACRTAPPEPPESAATAGIAPSVGLGGTAAADVTAGTTAGPGAAPSGPAGAVEEALAGTAAAGAADVAGSGADAGTRSLATSG